tara:strand:+ start:107 stop:628 length:522 start_codon:yes stop_codon:yes gene_type:complete
MENYLDHINEIPEKTKNLFKNIKLVAFDFDGVFTDNYVYSNDKGEEMVKSSKLDGFGLSKLDSLGIKKVILSTETNESVKKRAEKLNIDCEYGLVHKEEKLKEISINQKIDLKNIAFVGNDINDIAALKICGLPIVVRDSHPEIINFAKYVTVLKGGNGAVREVCDIIERLNQ